MPLTRLVKSAPNELSPAELHLEDIDEIQAIFVDMIRVVAKREGFSGDPEIIYKVGDLTSPDILSFRARMKRIHDMELQVMVGYARLRLSLSKHSCLWFESAGLDEAQKWSVYNRLKEIFDAKKLRLKSVTGLDYALIALAPVAFIALVLAVFALFEDMRYRWLTGVLGLFVTALFVVLTVGYLSPPAVVLHYSSDLRTKREERRWDIIKIAGGGFLGAILGVIGTLLVQHFRK